MSGVKGFPRTVISTLISQVITKLNTGLNLLAGGSAVSSSNPLPVNSQLDSKTSNSQAALDGISAKCWINCPAVATKFSAVQIWNPVGSGVNLLCVGLTGMNASTTMKWFQHLDDTQLSTEGGFQQNLKVGAAELPFEIYYQSLDAKTATDGLGVTISATTPQGGSLIMAGETICIPEGYGIRYEADTANISITMFATLIASSNA